MAILSCFWISKLCKVAPRSNDLVVLITNIGQTTPARFRQSSDQRAILLREEIPSGNDKDYDLARLIH